jgi:hypothetical protein
MFAPGQQAGGGSGAAGSAADAADDGAPAGRSSGTSTASDDAQIHVTLSANDVSCSICKDVFLEPITTPCGHTFCKPCLLQWMIVSGTSACPQCRFSSSAFSRAWVLSSQPGLFITDLIRQTFYTPCPDCREHIHPTGFELHSIACPKATVPCHNSAHGCAQHLPRDGMDRHLALCAHHLCAGHTIGCTFTGTSPQLDQHKQTCRFAQTRRYIEAYCDAGLKALEHRLRQGRVLYGEPAEQRHSRMIPVHQPDAPVSRATAAANVTYQRAFLERHRALRDEPARP